MSELKAFNLPRYAGQFTLHEVYLKSEADKVIEKLKKQKEYVIEYTTEVINALERKLRCQKYKRCLAMAYVEWLKQMSLCNYPDSILYRRAARRERKWKKIAEKFKPNKSTAQ